MRVLEEVRISEPMGDTEVISSGMTGFSKVMSVPEDMRPLESVMAPGSVGDPESSEVMKAPKVWEDCKRD